MVYTFDAEIVLTDMVFRTLEEDIDKDAFDLYCLQPALHRRGIVKEQCHFIDSEFKARMPEVWIV